MRPVRIRVAEQPGAGRRRVGVHGDALERHARACLRDDPADRVAQWQRGVAPGERAAGIGEYRGLATRRGEVAGSRSAIEAPLEIGGPLGVPVEPELVLAMRQVHDLPFAIEARVGRPNRTARDRVDRIDLRVRDGRAVIASPDRGREGDRCEGQPHVDAGRIALREEGSSPAWRSREEHGQCHGGGRHRWPYTTDPEPGHAQPSSMSLRS
jgi:hypothetical protein